MANLDEVNRLLEQLEDNLKSATLSLQRQEELLGKVKAFGRDPNSAKPIFRKKGITTLSRYGLDGPNSSVSREALRCLANAMLLDQPCRQTFLDLGCAPKMANRLKHADFDDEFLECRILFLLTYKTNLDLSALVDETDLGSTLVERMSVHAKRYLDSSQANRPLAPMAEMAMVESLKLIFNMLHHEPDTIDSLKPAMNHVISILVHRPLTSPPLQPAIITLLNALLNLISMEEEEDLIFPPDAPASLIDRLLSILDKATREHSETDLEQDLASLCVLLRRFYKIADSSIQSKIRSTLLPKDSDRDQPLGKGDTLAARLLQLSTSPHLPTLRDNISSFLFELSDSNPDAFVQNIGYGYASGFLMSHNIPVPGSATDANGGASKGSRVWDDSAGDSHEPVNPITGQKLSREPHEPGGSDDMTEEEKEREAERLFVLFERLRATGVVDVENPVTRARDEGRFEEIE